MSKLTKLDYKNYLATIKALPNSQLFRHIYVVGEKGNEFDAIDDGNLSCALVVSSVLLLFGWIDRTHATVQSTISALAENGWRETKEPQAGDIIFWLAGETSSQHIGFYIDSNSAISNVAAKRVPGEHKLKISDGRMPTAFYTRNFEEAK